MTAGNAARSTGRVVGKTIKWFVIGVFTLVAVIIVAAVIGVALVVPVASAATPGQKNAKRSAAQYLDITGFSRSGLIKQLKYEGYTVAQATWAIKQLKPNWSREAGQSATAYLDTMPFSRSALIKQLRYEGYTLGQATYGVKKAGL